jgi:hypothetical protein
MTGFLPVVTVLFSADRSRGVFVNFKYEEVVRIRLRNHNVELAAARLFHRSRSVLLERGKEVVDLAGHDIVVDRSNMEPSGLGCRLMVARLQQK